MAGNGRARSALMRNLPKKGWAVDGDVGTFGNLKLDFGEASWTMTKEGEEVTSGEYGRTQMADVKKAAKDAGSPFEGGGSSGSSGSGGGAGKAAGGTNAKAKQAAARAKKAAEKTGKETAKEPDAGDDPEG